jgi:hypothetical protein
MATMKLNHQLLAIIFNLFLYLLFNIASLLFSVYSHLLFVNLWGASPLYVNPVDAYSINRSIS